MEVAGTNIKFDSKMTQLPGGQMTRCIFVRCETGLAFG